MVNIVSNAGQRFVSSNINQKNVTQKEVSSCLSFGKAGKNYIVVDQFKGPKATDIDGDGIKDFWHGQTVARYIKAVMPLANIHTIHAGTECNIDVPEPENKDADIDIVKFNPLPEKEEEHDLRKLIAGLEQARDYVKTHDVDGLNLSVSVGMSFDQARQYCKKFNHDNFEAHKTELLEALERKLPDKPYEKLSTSDRVIYAGIKGARILEEIAAEGVEVCIAAGNSGKDNFVLFNLAQGVTPVGSKNVSGKRSLFTAQHQGIEYEQGEYASIRIKEDGKVIGYDINSDGIVDVKPEEVSGNGQALVDKFAGRPLSECKATNEEALDFCHYKRFVEESDGLLDLLIDLVLFWKRKPSIKPEAEIKKSPMQIKFETLSEEKLFDVNLACGAFEMNETETKKYKGRGDYVHISTTRVYRKDAEGKVVYDPNNTGEKDIVSVINGTSYASPIHLVKKTSD